MTTRLPGLYNGIKTAYVSEAYNTIRYYTKRGTNLLLQEEPDVLRLKIAAQKLQTKCVPLVHDFRRMPEVPKEWLARIAEAINLLETQLLSTMRALEGKEEPGK